MNEGEIHQLLEEHGAIQKGHFLLSSGKHSDFFVQSALILMWPGIAERLGHELGRRFEKAKPDVILGPAMGGVIIGHEIARQLGVPLVYSEREDGKMKLRRGFAIKPEAKVLIAENTVTTGGSQKEVIELARALDAEVVGVAAIVDRSGGVSFGVPFEALLHIKPNAWEAGDCPLCKDGSVPDSPGSRHLNR